MNSTKEQISANMLMFSVICFIQASSTFTSFIVSVLRQEAWISVVIGYFISIPIIGMYLKLAKLYPQKSLIEINDCVLGPVVGKLFSVLYIWFFFSLTFLNAHTIGTFIVSYMMPETPVLAVLVMITCICVYAARKGVETITRYGALFVIVVVLFISFNTTLLIKDMDFRNFFPVFSLPVMKYVQASHTMVTIPYCNIIPFMMLFPCVEKSTDLKKPVYLGLTFGGLTFLTFILRDIAVIGQLNGYMVLPSFEVMRLINVGYTLTKLEVMYIFLLIILQFFKLSILLFATSQAITQLLHLHSYKLLLPIVGALVIGFAYNTFPSSADNAYWGTNIAAHYSTFFEVILPVITLSAALVQKSILRSKGAEANSPKRA